MGNISAQDPQDFCRFCLNLSYMAVPLQVVQYNYAKIFVAGDVSLYKHHMLSLAAKANRLPSISIR